MSSDMPENPAPTHPGQVVRTDQTVFEAMDGRSHHWYLNPELAPGANMLVVRVQVPAGGGHPFHHHPHMEEYLYVLSGRAEQWVESEEHELGPGDSVHLPAGLIHATYNAGSEELNLLAILSPADADPPGIVDVSGEEPWCSLRPKDPSA